MDFFCLLDNSDCESGVVSKEVGIAAVKARKLCVDLLQQTRDIKNCVSETEHIWQTLSAEAIRENFASDVAQLGSLEERINKQIVKLDAIIAKATDLDDFDENTDLSSDVLL